MSKWAASAASAAFYSLALAASVSDYHSTFAAEILTAIATLLLTVPLWHCINAWREKRGRPRFKLERQQSPAVTSGLPFQNQLSASDGPLKWDDHLGHSYSAENNTIITKAILISAKNISEREVQLQDAYVISGDTGEKIMMKVGTNTGWLCPAETTALPPNGILTLRAEFNAPYGIAAVDFFRDWKIMHLITKYDDVPYRITVNEKMVSALYENFRPNPIGPRVTQLSGIMR